MKLVKLSILQPLLLLIFDYLIGLSSSARITHWKEDVIEHDPDDIYQFMTPHLDVKYSDGRERHFVPLQNENSLTSPEVYALISQHDGEHYQVPQEIRYSGNGRRVALSYYHGYDKADAHRVHRNFLDHVQKYNNFDLGKHLQKSDNGYTPMEKEERQGPPYSFLGYDKQIGGHWQHLYPKMTAKYNNNDIKTHIYQWEKPAMTPEYFKLLRRKNLAGEWEMPKSIEHQEYRMGPVFHYVAYDTRANPEIYYKDYEHQKRLYKQNQSTRTEASSSSSGGHTSPRGIDRMDVLSYAKGGSKH